MRTHTIAWNNIYEKIEKFYYRWVYDFEALRSIITISCGGCGNTFPADLLLGTTTIREMGGVVAVTTSPDQMKFIVKLSDIEQGDWRCPQCQHSEVQCSWVGPSTEAYRFDNFIEGGAPVRSHLLPPSEEGWSFLVSAKGNELEEYSPMAFSPVSDILAMSGYFSVCLWDPISGQKQELSYDQEDGYCGRVQILFTPNGEKIALVGLGFKKGTGEETTWTRVWNLCPRIHIWHKSWAGAPTSSAISPDSTILAIGNNNGSVHLLDIENGLFVKQIKNAHSKPVSGILFSSDRRHIFTCGEDGLRMWDYGFSTPYTLTYQPVHRITSIPNRDLILIQGETTNSIWEIGSTKPIKEYEFPEFGGLGELSHDVSPSFSPDGHFLAFGSTDVTLLDIDRNQVIDRVDLGDQDERADFVLFSANGGFLALYGQFSGDICIWRVGSQNRNK